MAGETGPTKAELADRIDDIEDLLEEALDPELTREELVSNVKEIQTVARPRKARPIWRSTRNRVSMMTAARTRTTEASTF